MQMKSKLKVKTVNVTGIGSRDQAESAITAYTQVVLNIQRMTADLDEKITALRDQAGPALDTLGAKRDELVESLCAWAQAHPEEFPKGLKSIEFANGVIGFRTGTPRLSLLNRKWNWELVLEAVWRVLPAFVREKPEVDKEAIINQRTELAEYLPMVGLKVEQAETFFVDPNLTEVEQRAVANGK